MFHCVLSTPLRRIYSPVSNNHQELLGIYIADNFMKLCEIGFAMECIMVISLNFLAELSNFVFCLPGGVLAISS